MVRGSGYSFYVNCHDCSTSLSIFTSEPLKLGTVNSRSLSAGIYIHTSIPRVKVYAVRASVLQ